MTSHLFSGIDLVEINRFRELNPLIRERFFMRVFTQNELETIAGSFERAAGIFASKEAVVKALGCGIGQVSWQDVAIGHDDQGKPIVILFGAAKIASEALRIREWSISISHTRSNAVAVAVALVDPHD